MSLLLTLLSPKYLATSSKGSRYCLKVIGIAELVHLNSKRIVSVASSELP